MIRFIGAGMIVISAALIGVYLNSRLYKRQKYLESFIAALEQFRAYICFSDYEMEKALLLADGVCDTGGIFKETAENMRLDGIKAAWQNAVLKSKSKMCLSDADAEAVLSLGERLGLTDSEDQKKNIDNVISALKRLSEEARADYKKNGRLYRSCSVLCGALVALMLI